jgi:hypothetical protein
MTTCPVKKLNINGPSYRVVLYTNLPPSPNLLGFSGHATETRESHSNTYPIRIYSIIPTHDSLVRSTRLGQIKILLDLRPLEGSVISQIHSHVVIKLNRIELQPPRPPVVNIASFW